MTKAKIFAPMILIVFLLATVLGGCGQPDENDSQNGGQQGDVSVEDFPNKTITYMIPFDPGGQSDVEARRQEPNLEDILGVNVNIEYRAGGGGSVGWSELIKQDPDGYYIGGINIPHIILQPLEREDAGYETDQIKPVALVQATPIGLAVPKDSEFDTLDELIEHAKENPGSITVGGVGTYTGHHITTLQFQNLTGAEFTYVPFTGAAPQISGFLGGHVAAVFANSNDLVKHRDEMKVLAIGTEETFPQLSDVPTFAEQGVEMYPRITRGVGVPKDTPDEIVQKLEDAFLEIVKDEEINEAMIEDGFEPKEMGAEESASYINEKQQEFEQLLEDVE